MLRSIFGKKEQTQAQTEKSNIKQAKTKGSSQHQAVNSNAGIKAEINPQALDPNLLQAALNQMQALNLDFSSIDPAQLQAVQAQLQALNPNSETADPAQLQAALAQLQQAISSTNLGTSNQTGTLSPTQLQALAQLQTPNNTNPQTPNNTNPNSPTQEPIPAIHLENAMIENIRSDTPETRAKVYQELLFSELLLTLVDPSPETPVAKNPDGTPAINVAILSNPQGFQFAAVFTSALAAKRWRAEGGNYVSVRGQDIFKYLEPSPAEVIVINPASAPFVVLNKDDYRQLATGSVPQTTRSPVHVSATPSATDTPTNIQISFPPDIFTEIQKNHVHTTLFPMEHVQAVVIGAVLPPNASKDTGWIRTIFLKIVGLEHKTPQELQKFCQDIRSKIYEDASNFTDVQFEVGIMPDPNFWQAVHQNKFALFDKNPPEIIIPTDKEEAN